ncbi:hypothetical protein [Streptomyces sp. DT171]|uniref:hypothetical protein n=1 Tax=Streptomyces sp. DT171 TaxID=3416524 RepID=UPI003CF02DC2
MMGIVLSALVAGVVAGMVGRESRRSSWRKLRRALRRQASRRRGAQGMGAAPVGIPCMLKWEARSARWRTGRLVAGEAGSLTWIPSWGKREVALPAELRRTGARAPSVREGMSFNPRSRIVECASPEGDVLIAVMPEELTRLAQALGSE